MAEITFAGARMESDARESVLDVLLRSGHVVPHSCRAGACQGCLMQSVDVMPPAQAQRGLKPALTQQRYFLACQWRPEEAVEVRLPGTDETTVAGRIVDLTRLNEVVLRVRIEPAEPFECLPGQHVGLVSPLQAIRSYSIANMPARDGYLELHVRRVPNGLMSGWLYDSVGIGDTIRVRPAAGSCCYDAADAGPHPLLLAGTGTGLAPLLGVVRDALAQGHRGEIRLVHGALEARDLYYVDELRALARDAGNLTYVPCVLNGSPPTGGVTGDIQDAMTAALDGLESPRAYLCGAPDFVVPAKKRLFLAGIGLNAIYSDPFLPTRD